MSNSILYIVTVFGICFIHFWMYYRFTVALFKKLTSSVNEYLGNVLDYYFKHLDDKPDPNVWCGKSFRLIDNFNDDDLEEL